MNRIPVALHPTIREMYIDREMTKRAIAEHYDTTLGTVRTALRAMRVQLTKAESDDRNRRRMAALRKPSAPVIVKPAPPFSITDLINAAAKLTGTTPQVLCSAGRWARMVRIRIAIFYIAKDHYSRAHIGRAIGGRDHTTVIYGIAKAESRIATDWQFRALVDSIRDEATRTKQAERRSIAFFVERMAA